MVWVLLQPGLCLLLGPASNANANASPWQAGAESPSIIKEDSSLYAEKMKATEWDREKSVGQTCGNSGGVREHPRRKWGGKRGETGRGREVRGRSHPHTCRQTNVFLSVLLGSRVSAAADRAPPCTPCGSLPRAYHHTSAARHVLRDTHEKSDNWQKKNKGSIIYVHIYIYTYTRYRSKVWGQWLISALNFYHYYGLLWFHGHN